MVCFAITYPKPHKIKVLERNKQEKKDFADAGLLSLHTIIMNKAITKEALRNYNTKKTQDNHLRRYGAF